MNIDDIAYNLSLFIQNNPMIVFAVIAVFMVVTLGVVSTGGSKSKGKKGKLGKEFGKMSKQELNKVRAKGGATGAQRFNRRKLPTKIRRTERRAKMFKDAKKAGGKQRAYGGGKDVGGKRANPVGGNLERAMRDARKAVKQQNKEKAKALQEGKSPSKKKKKKSDNGMGSSGLGF